MEVEMEVGVGVVDEQTSNETSQRRWKQTNQKHE